MYKLWVKESKVQTKMTSFVVLKFLYHNFMVKSMLWNSKNTNSKLFYKWRNMPSAHCLFLALTSGLFQYVFSLFLVFWIFKSSFKISICPALWQVFQASFSTGNQISSATVISSLGLRKQYCSTITYNLVATNPFLYLPRLGYSRHIRSRH